MAGITAAIQPGGSVRDNEVIKVVDTGYNVPHNFQICVDFDGPDVWAGTSKGLGHGIGQGYYPKLRPADAAGAKTAITSRAVRSEPS